MIDAIRRKLTQVVADPSLRRFLVERALGRLGAPAPFVAGHPPYLTSLDPGCPPALDLSWFEPPRPQTPITLDLTGQRLTLEPGEASSLFTRSFDDLETQLAVHRFAWLPLQLKDYDPAWVGTLWQAWCDTHGTIDDSWAWHPYTAAERAINMLDFAKRVGGMPGQKGWKVLSDHVPVIASRLEYGGEHYTGNHLSNNGRGLYLLGLALGWEQASRMGLNILLNEAARIFSTSGILREGSSHYHLLLTRNYLSAWLAARRHNRPETCQLETICCKALAIRSYLDLPGRFPLIGDISPDCPPAFLTGILNGTRNGWLELLDDDDFNAVTVLAERSGIADAQELAKDGWVRAREADWSLLVHAAPHGWPYMPGHGHHDLGSFELHWRGVPLVIDAGRGAYGETGDAALYRSAAVHNGMQLNGADPTAANRPYYDDAFRLREGGEFPTLTHHGGTVVLKHGGFRRQGAQSCQRIWRLSQSDVTIDDRIQGHAWAVISRNLVTPWPMEIRSDAIILDTPAGAVKITCDAGIAVSPLTLWNAYGAGTQGWRISMSTRQRLPWSGQLTLESI